MRALSAISSLPLIRLLRRRAPSGAIAAAHWHTEAMDPLSFRTPLRRICGAAAVSAIAMLAAAGPALADSLVSVAAPASAKTNTQVDIVYSGVAEGPENAYMTLFAFYQRNVASCAATADAQRKATGSSFDAQQFIATPAPFTFTSPQTFTRAGSYRFCAYLQPATTAETDPPLLTAQAVVEISEVFTNCTVPSLSKLTVAAATAKLKANGCTLGKITKVKGSGTKPLFVRRQNEPQDTVLALNGKVNVVIGPKVVKKKKR